MLCTSTEAGDEVMAMLNRFKPASNVISSTEPLGSQGELIGWP